MVIPEKVSANLEKIKSIVKWPMPNNIHDTYSFHGLATFYRRFIRGFTTIAALITDYIRKGAFVWTTTIDIACLDIKENMTQAPS